MLSSVAVAPAEQLHGIEKQKTVNCAVGSFAQSFLHLPPFCQNLPTTQEIGKHRNKRI